MVNGEPPPLTGEAVERAQTKAWSQSRGQVWLPVWSLPQDGLRQQLRACVNATIWNLVEEQIEGQVWDRIEDRVWVEISGHVWQHVER